jgi:hypothetical protein
VIAGVYSFVYCGAQDVGIGHFTLHQDGRFFGVDIGGVMYEATAQENDAGWITLDLTLTIPVDTSLVMGTSPQDTPHTRRVHAYLPPAFGDGYPQQMEAAPGIITIMVKRVPDHYRPVVSDVYFNPSK